jgi:8-oxo-dGTP diphosphatase
MTKARPAFSADPVICTVDVVLLTLHQGSLHVVLAQRDRAPHEGAFALPGGFIHTQEDDSAWHAAARVLRDKAGIDSPYLEQMATWSGPQRDSRGWSVSIVYYALIPEALVPTDDASVQLHPVHGLPPLPFDHADMVTQAIERVRNKSQYSSLPVYLCGETFTLPHLQSVYEAVLGESINKVSFRRKMEEMGMLDAIEGAMESGGAHRPAQIYRLKPNFRHHLSLVERGINA